MWRSNRAALLVEIFKDAAPVAFVLRTSAMALVDDDEIEEVGRILAEIGLWLSVRTGAAHKGLENREEDTGVLRNMAVFADFAGLNTR